MKLQEDLSWSDMSLTQQPRWTHIYKVEPDCLNIFREMGSQHSAVISPASSHTGKLKIKLDRSTKYVLIVCIRNISKNESSTLFPPMAAHNL